MDHRSALTGWPLGEGGMAASIRAYDWAPTALGSLERWPHALRTAVDIMLAMPSPATILWGPKHVQLYNDAYIPIARDRHPLLLGRPVAEGWPDAHDAVIAPLLENACSGRATQLTTFPVLLDSLDGPQERVFDTDWVPIRDESGAVAGILQTLAETTDRLKAQAALRKSEERHSLLIGSWAQAVWNTDPDGVVISDSPSWRAYTGQTLQEWLGHGWLDAIHPDDRAYAERQWREATAAQGLVDAEFRLCAPDGGWRWTNIRAAPVLDAKGDIEKWVGMNIDIDARKRAEFALRNSESRLRAMFDSVDQGYMEVEVEMSPEGRAIDWRYLAINPAFHRLTGMEDVTGRLASEVFPDREPEWAERYAQVVTTGEPMRFELPAAAIGRWFDINLVNVEGAGNRRIAVVYDDVTERKRAEAVLHETQERQAFLLTLSDALRAEPDPEAVAKQALRMLFEQMRLDRCHIGNYRLAEDIGELSPQVHHEHLPPIPGQVRLSDFPEAFRVTFDRTLVVDDLEQTEAFSDNDRASFRALGMGALIAATLRKGKNQPLWAIVVASTSPRVWTQGEVSLVEEVAERTWAAVERARTEAGLRDSADHQALLLAELQHRVRNSLTMVRSLARRTAENCEDVDDYVRHLDGRLSALARVQTSLARDPREGVSLSALVLDELTCQATMPAQYDIGGPTVTLLAKAAEVLSLAVHELATNSVKYGVLGEMSGAIRIRWAVEDRDGQDWLRFTWVEPIDSKIERPVRTGFGSELIKNRVPYELHGTGDIRVGADKVEARIDFPLTSGQSVFGSVAAQGT